MMSARPVPLVLATPAPPRRPNPVRVVLAVLGPLASLPGCLPLWPSHRPALLPESHRVLRGGGCMA